MNTPSTLPLLKGCRFQREIIAYAIWVYYRFAFSTTDIEDLFVEPWVIVTDKLCSYFKLSRELVPNADHRSHKGLSNLLEGSHTPTRKREKVIGRFKSPRQAQRFIAGHDQADTVFHPRRYRAFAISYRHARDDAFDRWNTYAVEMTT